MEKVVKNDDGTVTFQLNKSFDLRTGPVKTVVLRMPNYQQSNLARKLTQHITKAFMKSSSSSSTSNTTNTDDGSDILDNIDQGDLIIMQIQNSDIDYSKFCSDVQDLLGSGCATFNGEKDVPLKEGYVDQIGYNDYEAIIKEYVYHFLVSAVIIKMLSGLKK